MKFVLGLWSNFWDCGFSSMIVMCSSGIPFLVLDCGFSSMIVKCSSGIPFLVLDCGVSSRIV